METYADLEFGHHRYGPDTCVLVTDDDGQAALWVERRGEPYTYTLNDNGESVAVAPDENVTATVAEWRHAVGADEPPDTRCTYCDALIEDGTECALCAARA